MKRTDIIVLAALLACGAAFGQESKGTASVTAQGFYAPGGFETVRSTTGIAAEFRYILPAGMLLEGKAENYAASGFRLTENYLTLRGLAAGGWRLEFNAGDFNVPGRQLDFFLPQIYTPMFRLRGARVQGLRGRLGWSGYAGAVTYMEGPRLPFSVLSPQTRGGGGLNWKASETLEFAGQFDVVSTQPGSASGRPHLLQPGRRYARAAQAAAMASWKPLNNLRLLGEAAHTSGTPLDQTTVKPSPWNALAAAEYEYGRGSVRASYARQTAGYTPVAGYYTGDRGSGFVEGRIRPWRRADLYASAGSQSNNFERNPAVWTFHSKSVSTGVSLDAGAGVNLSTQLSRTELNSDSPSGGRMRNTNRQLMLMASKSYGSHSTRFSYRHFEMRHAGAASGQGAVEGEQSVRLGRWMTSAAVRYGASRAGERRDSLFVRGMVQGNIGRASIHAFSEAGRDLANETLFAMNQIQTTVAGFNLPIGRGWNVQGEVLKTTIATALNPQSAFVLASNGVPVSLALGGLDRLNIFFRVTRNIGWGGPSPVPSAASSLAGVTPVSGAIEGIVTEAGQSAVEGIPIVLDGHRLAFTGANGRYRFPDVPQGSHRVEVSPRELPAEFDPAVTGETAIFVRSARTERRDFQLVRLTSLHGQVLAPPNSKLDEIVIRLPGARRVTTPDEDGRFAFHNLPAGEYEVVLDESTIAEGRRLSGPSSLSATAKAGAEPAEAIFGLEAVVKTKKVRQVDLQSSAPKRPAPAESVPAAGDGPR
ncbi:MAG: hypothetical protein C0504_02335 [Candidatus Solibacter sp.]|nr:hypothetical protein [Candidatus Solibacter sp.]